jgi:hypothetical protein
MDLSSGSALAAAIGLTLNREDLTAHIPSWIAMAEAGFNRDLRLSAMIRRSVATDVDENFISLPPLCQEIRNLTVTGPDGAVRALDVASPEQVDNLLALYPAGGYPQVYAVVGDEIQVAPTPNHSITYEILFYEKIPALDATSAVSTNWLLTKAPDLYLYSALVHSAPYLIEDERLQTWGALAASITQSLITEEQRALYAGGRLVARRRGYGAGNLARRGQTWR